jgi:hypothetical protein
VDVELLDVVWDSDIQKENSSLRACVLRLCEKSNLAEEIASCMHRIRVKVQLRKHKTSNFPKLSRVFTQSLFLLCKVCKA